VAFDWLVNLATAADGPVVAGVEFDGPAEAGQGSWPTGATRSCGAARESSLPAISGWRGLGRQPRRGNAPGTALLAEVSRTRLGVLDMAVTANGMSAAQRQRDFSCRGPVLPQARQGPAAVVRYAAERPARRPAAHQRRPPRGRRTGLPDVGREAEVEAAAGPRLRQPSGERFGHRHAAGQRWSRL
jgi:hypothetical protein